jgi:hypothetical protein
MGYQHGLGQFQRRASGPTGRPRATGAGGGTPPGLTRTTSSCS